ncbi:MAG: ATP-binding protein [Deltaproteobacteria bacterium]|nr:ATP-binding protein [Deltaproteobacteria bacterium]
MTKKQTLSPSHLRVRLNPRQVKADRTRNEQVSFQPRAIRALNLALEIPGMEYNVFVAGEAGFGRSHLVRTFLGPRAATLSRPDDWAYVHNFQDQDRPRALRFPAGRGRRFKQELTDAVRRIREELPEQFEQESYARQHDNLVKEFDQTREGLLESMDATAVRNGFSLNLDEGGGLSLYPLVEGKVLTTEEYEKLTPEVRRRLKSETGEIMDKVMDMSRQIDRAEQTLKDKERELDRKVGSVVIDRALETFRQDSSWSEESTTFLDRMKADMLDNIHRFRGPEPGQDQGPESLVADNFFYRYEVNLFVDHEETGGAPVIVENNPSFFNLLGCIERETELGTYYTDFTLLKPGSIHRANGGFLVLHAEDLLTHPLSWEGLLRCLRSRQAGLEDPTDHYDLVRTKTLEPEPIPLDLKIILVGTDAMYETLLLNDDRFGKFFKLKAHIQERVDRNPETIEHFIGHLLVIAEEASLRPFSRDGLARLVDASSRLAQDQQKLSLEFSRIRDVMIEANALAGLSGRSSVGLESVNEALEDQLYRANLYEQEFLDDYDREVIKVRTQGSAAGRANGLSVSEIGGYVMGLPHEISCIVGVGHGGILDLEREAELGGPIHTKGMMILKSYLLDLFARNKPLVMSGSLCFEQSYAHVDGDSASGAELAALLSALSGVPINLGYAFTGAVSQSGAIMAVGEVARKVEGFFEVCRRRGLTGEQGVLIPRDNVINLMMRDEVVEAVAAGMFHIFPVQTIEEALEILTGRRAGARLKNGRFSKNSIYEAVDRRLSELAALADERVKKPRRRT